MYKNNLFGNESLIFFFLVKPFHINITINIFYFHSSLSSPYVTTSCTRNFSTFYTLPRCTIVSFRRRSFICFFPIKKKNRFILIVSFVTFYCKNYFWMLMSIQIVKSLKVTFCIFGQINHARKSLFCSAPRKSQGRPRFSWCNIKSI